MVPKFCLKTPIVRAAGLIAGSLVVAMAAQARADVIGTGQSYYFTPTGPFSSGAFDNSGTPQNIGTGFVVPSAITVDALGAYEGGNPSPGPLNTTSPGDTFAMIYEANDPNTPSSGGTLVTSIEIRFGTTNEDAGYAFAELPAPVTLSPGVYFITALSDYSLGTGTSSSYGRYASSAVDVGDGITLQSPSSPAVFGGSITPTGSYPGFIGTGGSFAGGGNFIYTVPEPASAGLAITAGAASLIRRRRRV